MPVFLYEGLMHVHGLAIVHVSYETWGVTVGNFVQVFYKDDVKFLFILLSVIMR